MFAAVLAAPLTADLLFQPFDLRPKKDITMSHLTKLALAALLAVSLSACNGDHTAADHAAMDHSQDEIGDIGQTTGTLVSVSPDGQSATIKHEAIDGVGMGAMTMGFEIASSVDLSAFAANDPVSFIVKRGSEGGYRITAICNTETDGADCLSALVDHAGH